MLPDGAIVFADANVLVYHFTQVEPLASASTAFLERGLRQRVAIVTTPQVVSDVIHRVMLLEARVLFQIPGQQLTSYLKKHPDVVKQLSQHLDIASLLKRFNIDIRPITHLHLHASKRFRRDYGFMANDSLILGFMATERIQHLASNDGDFERAPVISLWKPDEMPHVR